MQFTELWSGGPKYSNDGRAFPLTTDAVLLANFASGKCSRRVLDVGCGSGIIGLLIAWNNRDAHVTGIDISESAIACARENIAENSLDGRFIAAHGDILHYSGTFDLIVCNPPYFERGRGKSAGSAREESTATLSDFTERSSALLCPGGALCVVLRPDRLSTLLGAMTEFDLSPSRLRLVSHTAGFAPSMALVEARRGISTELEVLPQLLLKDENGGDSQEIRRIYRMK